jgi:hypothetical protein
VGIPEITVEPRPRITDAASLYTLGAAYTIAPEKVETFLAANWPTIANLLTDHGPWEGYNATRQEVIPYQTTAHTLALVLGLVGTGSAHMTRYLEAKRLTARRDELFAAAAASLDLLSDATRVFAWTDKESAQESRRDRQAFLIRSDRVSFLGIALVAASPQGLNLSGGRLRLAYRCGAAMEPAVIELKPVGQPEAAVQLIPKEITTRFAVTAGREAEIEVPLPAMPGLRQVKEVVITFDPGENRRPVDLVLTRAELVP